MINLVSQTSAHTSLYKFDRSTSNSHDAMLRLKSLSINYGVNLLNTKTVLNCLPTGCKHMKTDEEVEEVFNILERRLYDDPSKVRGV